MQVYYNNFLKNDSDNFTALHSSFSLNDFPELVKFIGFGNSFILSISIFCMSV